MADVPAKTQITVNGEAVSVGDLARQAQFDAPYNMLDEFSWTLIALCHYFPDESSWTAAEELELTWETLVEQELLQDIDYSPCGGTHRLAGLVAALNAKSRLELPDSETWKQAAEKVHNHFAKVKASRGADGRLTSLYFTGSGKVADLAGELASTGHLFEFVALAADDQQIQEDWIALAASHLCGLIEQTEHLDLDCGALYHALHGLKIYRSRIKS